jgi:cell division topological specificity factor
VRFLSCFKTKKIRKNSASLARERLQIIVSHQRSEMKHGGKRPEYIHLMEQEIMKVIKKYINVKNGDIKIEIDKQDACSVLELNVTLPEG